MNLLSSLLAYTARQIAALRSADTALGVRIDQAIGAVAADAEVVDGRTGADGVTYTTIGVANRTQFSNLKADLSQTSVFINGNGTTYVGDVYDIVSSGHTYRIYVQSWDTTGLSISSSQSKLVLGYTDNGSNINVFDVRGTTDISAYYDISIPMSAVSPKLVVGGRIASNKVGVLHLKDITLEKASNCITVPVVSQSISENDIERGLYRNDSGKKQTNNTRLRSIDITKVMLGSTISFMAGTSIEKMAYVAYDEELNVTFASDWLDSGEHIVRITSEVGYVGVMFKKSDDSTVTVADYDATTKIIQNEVYENHISLEHGGYNSSSANRFYSTYTNRFNNMRSKYSVMLNGSKGAIFPFIDAFIMLYDANDTLISNTRTSTHTSNTIIQFPDNAVYMDIQVVSGSISTYTFRSFGNAVYEGKRIYTNGGDSIVQDIDVNDTFTCMCYKLPPNYTQTGEKVPIVIFIPGNKGYQNLTSDFAQSARAGINYLRDEGYAVIQIFGWGAYYKDKYPNCGSDHPYPIPISEECIAKCLQTFIDEYNVDGDSIHIIGRSFGGMMSLHYALHPLDGMKTVTMFDPVIDFLSMRGRFSDARKALVEELSFNGTAEMLEDFYDIEENGSTSTGVQNYYFSERCQPLWAENMPALIRLNPTWDRLVGDTYRANYATALEDAREWWFNGKKDAQNIYTHSEHKVISSLPVKIMGATDDTDTPSQIYTEKAEQLRNSGNPAELYLVPSGGHDAVSVSTTYAEDITTVLGIFHEAVPIGWIEAVKWIRKNI